ncbi:MAG: hypothetical protein PHP83_04120 [Clostridia bacterium]|nr:hypothetical protein [Clostridia bacterium]
MKKQLRPLLIILMLALIPLLLVGCKKEIIHDGIKLIDTKIITIEGKDSVPKSEYKTLKFSCVVKNTTGQTLSFEVVFSYRSGGLFDMRTKSHKQIVTLSAGESKSLTYTTDKIYNGIIDEKKISIANVN